MKPAAKLLLTLTGSIVAFSTTSQAQIAYTGAYVEDFNNLPTVGNLTGGYAAWTDNSTLAGWYAVQESGTLAGIGPTTGSGTTYALKSFGPSGSSDRALGSMAGNATGSYFYGVKLVNNTTETITSLDISYYGEVWRRGASSPSEYQGLLFSYSQNATGISDPDFGNSVSFSALDFVSDIPTFASSTNTSTAVDGNLNALLVEGTLTLVTGWAPGTALWLRWTDLNTNGFDSGLGIDDLMVTTASAIPEPQTYALIIAAGLWLAIARRRRTASAA